MKRNLKQLIAQMTLEEKASLCSGQDLWRLKGIERLGIPSIMVTDGPHGLRKQSEGGDILGLTKSVPATCFPTAAGVASSWDRELIGQMGKALGAECQAENVAVLLGPGVNIKRSPLCGRNFEYFSEDPYLSSVMAASHIEGVQSQGVGTSLKHFAANNQEHRRLTSDSIVDERTLREIYLASFEGAVKKAQPWTVMCSYNKVNGQYASENSYLLRDILKDEWGHEGIVVSDWGAVNDRVDGLAAGLELEMPSSQGWGDRKIVEAVLSGKIAEETLDQSVERLLALIFKAYDNRKEEASFDPEAHHRLARGVARESMVLLKNEEQLLPLPKSGRIAAIGELARRPRYQGSGSSRVTPTKLEDIVEELVASAGSAAQVVYAQGYRLNSDDADQTLIEEARQAAAQADVAVIFAGLPDRYESEGMDRTHLRLPDNQVDLIRAIAEVQPKLVVVLSNGSPVEMPWIGEAKAVLEAYLGGQALGGAIADLLFGDANPCGKLAETFPKRLEDNPSYLFFPGEGDRVEYREGLYVGYRYYEAKKVEPLFPFGHGLSYTTFAYSDLQLNRKEMRDDEKVTVQVTIENTGDRLGKEIVQLYVRPAAGTAVRPVKELKGFAKIELQPGERTTIAFELDKRAFAYYNVDMKDWHVETGAYGICIGRSSADIVLTDDILVHSTAVFKKQPYTRNSTIGELMGDPAALPFVQQLMEGMQALASAFAESGGADHGGQSGAGEMMEAMMKHTPLRSFVTFSGGKMSEEMLAAVLDGLNGTRPVS